MTESADSSKSVQLHLVLPYKFEPSTHPKVHRYLEQGYRIVELQRITDREALVTLSA